MKEKKVLNQLIALLPMPAVVIDNKGIIEEANIVFKEKFNFNRISKKNKVRLQTFLNSPHGKYMAEYIIPGMDFGPEAFLDKLDEYYNERMLKKYAKDFKGLA